MADAPAIQTGVPGTDDGPPAAPRPAKPSQDLIVDGILKAYEFARDVGGELFLLPGPKLPHIPYVPCSFLTQEVKWLVTRMWREIATVWNQWFYSLDEDSRALAQAKLQEETGEKTKLKAATKVPSPSVVSSIVGALESEGMHRARKVNAELRAVQGSGYLIIDLGDASGKVVYVTAEGWWVKDPRELAQYGVTPPIFRRSIGYFPLPEPVYGGDLDTLWQILHVQDPAAIALGTGWLTAAFFANVSRPGIWATGVSGSGKTTLAIGLVRLIDGVKWLRGKMDKNDERNNIIRAVKTYVGTYDNITSVTAEQSDWLCTMVTGRVDTFRKMKTNFDDISMEYKRTFVATGLSLPYGLVADALERIIEVPCTPVSDSTRVGDAQIQVALDAARSQILGAILDHVVMVLRTTIPEDQRNHSRMAEYADILTAHDIAYGTKLLDAYLVSVKSTREEKANGEPIVMALEKLFTRRPTPCKQCAGCKAPGYGQQCTNPQWLAFSWCKCTVCTQKRKPGQEPATCIAPTWRGTAEELLEVLGNYRTFGGQVSAYWPGSGRALSDKITEQFNVLASANFMILSARPKGKRTITITREWQNCQ